MSDEDDGWKNLTWPQAAVIMVAITSVALWLSTCSLDVKFKNPEPIPTAKSL